MPRGDKRHYTEKQRRKADHITESFLERGYPRKEAEGRAWATVNAIHGGGELKGGSGYGKPEKKAVYRKGGRRGGKAAAKTTTPRRSSRSAKATPKSAGRRRSARPGRSGTRSHRPRRLAATGSRASRNSSR